MKKEWEPRQSRATTHFKFYSEKYLWGSTRAELFPDERGVWIDFLCLATMNFGKIELYSRDQLAQQLLISRELLDRSIEKFIKFGKVTRKYYKKEKKEIFAIVKWSLFQADYLTKKARKSSSYGKKERIGKTSKSDAENLPTLKERKGKEIKSENITLDKINACNSENPNNHYSNKLETSSPLPSISNSFNAGELTLKDQFLSMLKDCIGYPFDEVKDSLLFEITATECPNINIIKQTKKKIAWWKVHPEALKASPREKLQEWFKEESKFQKRIGPIKIGEIMKELGDSDHRRWIKALIGNK